MIGALLLAAGKGARMQGSIPNKLLHPIGRSHAFSLSSLAFLEVGEIGEFAITYKDHEQRDALKASWKESLARKGLSADARPVHWIEGGEERQDSVQAGLLGFGNDVTHVLIHDCARPFIRPGTISRIALEVSRDRAICAARPLKDTLRRRCEPKGEASSPARTQTLERNDLWLIETPQGAPRTMLQDGLKEAQRLGLVLSDDMAAVELIGHPVGFLEPDYPNPKITTPDDFTYAEYLLKNEACID